MVCPVCEHDQATGSECEVCGKRLVLGVSAGDLAIPPIEGLEPTLYAPADVVEMPIGELEPTLLAGAGEVLPGPVPDLEETRAHPVDVDVAPVPDVERTQAGIPDDGPTAAPEFVTCRYCRTPAMPGERICARCGMRLPFFAAAAAVGEPAPQPICTCGSPIAAGASLCRSCGARLG